MARTSRVECMAQTTTEMAGWYRSLECFALVCMSDSCSVPHSSGSKIEVGRLTLTLVRVSAILSYGTQRTLCVFDGAYREARAVSTEAST